jgi:hypothetical protein
VSERFELKNCGHITPLGLENSVWVTDLFYGSGQTIFQSHDTIAETILGVVTHGKPRKLR